MQLTVNSGLRLKKKIVEIYFFSFFLHFSVRNIFLFFFLSFILACNEEYTPKPKGYFRISFPEHAYKLYNPDYCPFSFEYPVYANISRDTVFLDTVPENPCWMDVNFPDFNGSIFLSYKEINAEHNLAKLIEDAHSLTFKHTVKASGIDESVINSENHVYGLYYNIEGNAASNIQFFATDSVKHFIRGSLYFNNEPNSDSLGPVIHFVEKDIRHLIGTLKWK